MITTYIYLFSAFNIFLSAIMLAYNWKLNKNILYLTLFIVIFSFENIIQAFFTFGGNKNIYSYIFNNFSSLYYLKAPFLYFFFRGLINDNFTFKRFDWLHFIPFALQLINNIPYFLLPHETKLQIASLILSDMENFRKIDLHELFYPPHWNYMARSIQLFAYIVYISFLISSRSKLFAKTKVENFNQIHYITTWLKVLLLMIFVISIIQLICSYIFVILGKGMLYTQFITIFVYFGIYLYFSIPIFVLLNPKLLYGFIGVPVSQSYNVELDEKIKSKRKNTLKDTDAYSDLNIDQPRAYDENLELLSKNILNYMDTGKPYLKIDFQVKDVCMALNAPQHHIQFCLNEIIGKKFSDFKNEYRVNYAKQRLIEVSEEYSIEAVGRESGFASNSNFYSAFKQLTGYTPSQWLKITHSSAQI